MPSVDPFKTGDPSRRGTEAHRNRHLSGLGAQEEIAESVVAFLSSTVLSPDVTGAARWPSIER